MCRGHLTVHVARQSCLHLGDGTIPMEEGDSRKHHDRLALQGSNHFKNEQRKAASTDARIQRMKQHAARLTTSQLASFERCASSILALSVFNLQLVWA